MLVKPKKKFWLPSIAPYYKVAGGGGSPTQVRVTFKAPTLSSLILDHASIGIKAGAGNAWDTTATPVELKFSGVSGFNISASASITSDWANLVVSSSAGTVLSRTMSTEDLGWGSYSIRSILGPVTGGATSLVVIQDVNSSGNYLATVNAIGTDASYYFGPSAPNYNNATPSGGSLSAYNCFCVTSIETQ